mmetsp:Transcript_3521/g.5247  ORF Transcript_3521/g.5247 Transcript_3521/m.5247 type:complete len:208 (-) Transcript_3521:815-1438(-)
MSKPSVDELSSDLPPPITPQEVVERKRRGTIVFEEAAVAAKVRKKRKKRKSRHRRQKSSSATNVKEDDTKKEPRNNLIASMSSPDGLTNTTISQNKRPALSRTQRFSTKPIASLTLYGSSRSTVGTGPLLSKKLNLNLASSMSADALETPQIAQTSPRLLPQMSMSARGKAPKHPSAILNKTLFAPVDQFRLDKSRILKRLKTAFTR